MILILIALGYCSEPSGCGFQWISQRQSGSQISALVYHQYSLKPWGIF